MNEKVAEALRAVDELSRVARSMSAALYRHAAYRMPWDTVRHEAPALRPGEPQPRQLRVLIERLDRAIQALDEEFANDYTDA